jgi:rhodanese-related sulfurtransferase
VEGFAGSVEPRDVWGILGMDPAAVLVDVRTNAEWAYVGQPDLGSVGKKAVLLAWQLFPEMKLNAGFAGELAAAVPGKETPLYFLCRSGVRSLAAAKAMTALGYARCYNITGGFEGDPDPERHRGRINGWKAQGLPWIQG